MKGQIGWVPCQKDKGFTRSEVMELGGKLYEWREEHEARAEVYNRNQNSHDGVWVVVYK